MFSVSLLLLRIWFFILLQMFFLTRFIYRHLRLQYLHQNVLYRCILSNVSPYFFHFFFIFSTSYGKQTKYPPNFTCSLDNSPKDLTRLCLLFEIMSVCWYSCLNYIERLWFCVSIGTTAAYHSAPCVYTTDCPSHVSMRFTNSVWPGWSEAGHRVNSGGRGGVGSQTQMIYPDLTFKENNKGHKVFVGTYITSQIKDYSSKTHFDIYDEKWTQGSTGMKEFYWCDYVLWRHISYLSQHFYFHVSCNYVLAIKSPQYVWTC